jgi:hypothetical protein
MENDMGNVARVEPKQQAMATTHAPSESPMGSALAFLQSGGNIEQLSQMMDLQGRWDANEARKAFTVAMTGFKAEPVEILKRKNVSFATRNGDVTNYNHAELSDVTDGIGPALAKHQLSYRWNIQQEGAAIKVDCILTHVAGHFETVTMTAAPDNSGMKNAIQQVASTTTYLQRYTLLAITGMSTKGMDDDGHSHGTEPEVDTKAADWIAAAEAIASKDEYASRKAELIASYGKEKDIPKAVKTAFATKNAALQASQ